jgi:hypothetical protein
MPQKYSGVFHLIPVRIEHVDTKKVVLLIEGLYQSE